MGLFSGNTEWAVFGCRKGKFITNEMDVCIVGSGSRSDFQVPSEKCVKEVHFQVNVLEDGSANLSGVGWAKIRVNGDELDKTVLKPESDYLIQVGSRFPVVRGDRKISKWLGKLVPNSWNLIDRSNKRMKAMSLEELSEWANTDSSAKDYWVTLAGVESPEAKCPLD